MRKVVVITGGTSGIGAACTERFAAKGYAVYTISRHERHTENVVSLCADVTDAVSLSQQIKAVIEKEKRIDTLLCCAGFGISGALEYTESNDAHRQLEVNLFGTDNAVKAVLPQMRKQGYGKIIAVSSVAAWVTIPFQGWYSVSKAAINAYILALANEVRPWGIRVCAVMPGDIHTGFTSARQKSVVGDEVYEGRISRSVSRMEKDEQNGMSPKTVARQIVRLAGKRKVKPLCSVGLSYQLVCLLTKILPTRILNYIVFHLYGK